MDELLSKCEILILVVTTWAVPSERISHSHVITYFFHSFFCLLVTRNSNNCLLCMATLNTTIDWHNWDYTHAASVIQISRLKISELCTILIIFLQMYCYLMQLSINRNEGTRQWFTMVYWTRSKILIIIHNTVIKPFNIYWIKLMS